MSPKLLWLIQAVFKDVRLKALRNTSNIRCIIYILQHHSLNALTQQLKDTIIN